MSENEMSLDELEWERLEGKGRKKKWDGKKDKIKRRQVEGRKRSYTRKDRRNLNQVNWEDFEEEE